MAHEILSLHAGMNLRDDPGAFEPGETGETLGCCFSVPGQVTPMRSGLLVHSLPADILDAKRSYVNQAKYTFTTHSDGLRVTYDVLGSDHTVLIDANFTGTFTVLPVNDEYFVLTNGTLNRKWKPGWAATQQWGLNTPPVPVIEAVQKIETFEDFEDNSGWTVTGGGVTGAKSDDAAVYLDGSQSLKLNLDALTQITAIKLIDLDLSGHADASFNLPYVPEYTDRIASFTVSFSCQENGGFTTDYYYKSFTPQAAIGVFGTHKAGFPNSAFYVDWNGRDMTSLGVAVGQIIKNVSKNKTAIITNIQDQDATKDRIDGTLADSADWDEGDWMGVYLGVAGTWVTDNDVALSAFTRVGTDPDRNWSTITAIKIVVTAAASDTYINFDQWVVNRGTVTGTYQVAVAYQNALGNYGAYSDYCDPAAITGYAFNISNLVPDTDSQTVARRIAILSSNITTPWVVTLHDNTTTSLEYAENVTVLEEVENYFNNHAPPPGVHMVQWLGRIFIVDGGGQVHFNEPLMHEAFPLTYHRTIVEGEQLVQVSVLDQYLVLRGKGREYFMLINEDNFANWPVQKGAKEGCVSTRLLLDFGDSQVYASGSGFTASGQGQKGDYLPKVSAQVWDFAGVMGAFAGKKAYLAYTDKGGTPRVLRVDYTLGRPVAHYVENIAPAAIFADEILDKVYYALGAGIYEFDAGYTKIPAKIVLPMYGGNKQVKDWSGLYYELAGDPLTLTLKADLEAVAGSINLTERLKADYPQTFPQGLEGRLLEMTLDSQADADFTIYLPWKTIETAYAD